MNRKERTTLLAAAYGAGAAVAAGLGRTTEATAHATTRLGRAMHDLLAAVKPRRTHCPISGQYLGTGLGAQLATTRLAEERRARDELYATSQAR